jgi:hypothetical protein
MLHLQEHYHYPFKADVLVCDTKEMEEKMFVYDALPVQVVQVSRMRKDNKREESRSFSHRRKEL